MKGQPRSLGPACPAKNRGEPRLIRTRSISRRGMLRMATLSPLAWTTQSLQAGQASSGGLAAPAYTLSANIEIMFPREMPRDKRMEVVAARGLKAFSFWSAQGEEERAMLVEQKRTGLACASIAGSGRIGWTTGLTKTGFEQAYLDVITQNCEVAKKFKCPNLIIFVGEVQKDIPWEKQYRQILDGLGKAGTMAEKYGVYLCLEPLNAVESPQMSVLSAREGFRIISEVDHPRVRLDFDMYHLQLGEGNLTNNLKRGLEKGWIRLVQIGDVPGRKEPGTGEVNYANIFRALREARYNGYVDMEHGTTSTPEHAIEVVKRLAGVG
jgi:hydroxypyruvate isomerase